MKQLLLTLCFALFATFSFAQAPSSFPYSVPYPNDPTTGTTQFTATAVTSAGNAIIMSSSATNGFIGVCVSNCGKTGTAWIAQMGQVPMTISNASTALHYVGVSSTAGDGLDSGASTYPTAGAILGRVVIGASGGGNALVTVFPPETQGSSLSSSVCNAHYYPSGTLSDTISAAGAFATTVSVPDTPCIGAGTLITIKAHGNYITGSTASPKSGFSVTAGGTAGICPASGSSAVEVNMTGSGTAYGYFDIVCYVQIQVTGSSGTAVAWGGDTTNYQTGASGGSEPANFVNGTTVAFNTTANENVTFNETATLVSGQTFSLQSVDIQVTQ